METNRCNRLLWLILISWQSGTLHVPGTGAVDFDSENGTASET